MRFEVNETKDGVVAPSKTICKVKDCGRQRMHSRKRTHAFCKTHSGLRYQMSKKRYKEFLGSKELAVP